MTSVPTTAAAGQPDVPIRKSPEIERDHARVTETQPQHLFCELGLDVFGPCAVSPARDLFSGRRRSEFGDVNAQALPRERVKRLPNVLGGEPLGSWLMRLKTHVKRRGVAPPQFQLCPLGGIGYTSNHPVGQPNCKQLVRGITVALVVQS